LSFCKTELFFQQGIDGILRPVTPIDRHEVLTLAELSDAELYVIAAGGRADDEMKVIPPPSKD
jgi:hypothetical protein